MNLYIMRHGETEWNKQRLIQGSADIPLTEYGEKLARITRDGFSEDGIRFQKIYTSPLTRALRTAEIINEKQNALLIPDSRIREMNFGMYEGKTVAGTDQNIINCFQAPELYIPDETAESYEAVYARICGFLYQEIQPMEAKEGIENVLIVCHGAVIRAFLTIIRGQGLDEFWKIRQPNCSINLVQLLDGIFTVLRENILYYQSPDTRGIFT